MEEKITVSRTKSAIKNTIFNLIYQASNILVSLLVPPLLINNYGSAINGLIATLKQVITYVQLVGAGISDSTTFSLYKPLSKQDNKGISSIYNATNYAFNVAGILFSLIAIGVAFIYPMIIKSEINYFLVVGIVLALSIAGASEFFCLGKYRSLLVADQKIYVVNIAQVIGTIISTAATIVLIKLHCNIFFVQLISSLTYVLRIIILYVYIRKNYPYLDKKASKDMNAISKRKDATIHQLASLVIFGSQTLFIAKYCGLMEVSVYSVYNLVFVGISTVLSTVSSALLAGFGNVIAASDKEKLNKVYNVYEYIFYILTFTVFAITSIMIIPFVKLYTSGATDVNYIRSNFVILFTIMGLLNCLRTPGATIINASGHYKETKNRAIIEMILCVVFQFIFVQKFGIVGILIGTIIAYLYRTIDVIIYSHKRILKNSLKKTLFRIFVGFTLLIFVYLISNYININCNGYFEWMLFAVIISLIVGLIYLFVNMLVDKKTFKELKDYIINVIRK